MTLSSQQVWDRFRRYYTEWPSLGLAIDVSRMNFDDGYLATMRPRLLKACEDMMALEKGVVANPDEKRMVGHYWLRNPALSPTAEIRKEIEITLREIKLFSNAIHEGTVRAAAGNFTDVLVVGIGGSALGPQLVASALGHPRRDKMRVHFFDNTDPDGMDRTLASIGDNLKTTLCVVISKSGGTKETRNGMLEAKSAYQNAKLDFARQAVAITGQGSELDQLAVKEDWLRRFPMWDWVGGRTSETSAVGLLPAALQGIDIQNILNGAKACDDVSRSADFQSNPAGQLALMWYYIGQGQGRKDMVVLPYKDRLELFSKYLQQLVMESLGKELDLGGKVVHQGLAVYGNKGSTDQHAYVQQLRDGIENFFVTFVRVLRDRVDGSMAVEPNVTSGDYLHGFLLGTRKALHENGRESITVSIADVSPFSVGVLIALYERAVGLYANLVHINAYHQPGVEAGKKAAGQILNLQLRILEEIRVPGRNWMSAEDLTKAVGVDDTEAIFLVCQHLAANPDHGIQIRRGPSPAETTFASVGNS